MGFCTWDTSETTPSATFSHAGRAEQYCRHIDPTIYGFEEKLGEIEAGR